MVHLIPSWLVCAEIECTVHVALLKRTISQFKPVQQSRKQALISYWHNIHTLSSSLLALQTSHFLFRVSLDSFSEALYTGILILLHGHRSYSVMECQKKILSTFGNLFLNLEFNFSWPSWTSKYVISSWNTLYVSIKKTNFWWAKSFTRKCFCTNQRCVTVLDLIQYSSKNLL